MNQLPDTVLPRGKLNRNLVFIPGNGPRDYVKNTEQLVSGRASQNYARHQLLPAAAKDKSPIKTGPELTAHQTVHVTATREREKCHRPHGSSTATYGVTTLHHVSPALSASHPLTSRSSSVPPPTPTRVMLPEWADNDEDADQGVVRVVMDSGQCHMHVVLCIIYFLFNSIMVATKLVAVVVEFIGVTFCYALGAEPFSEGADDDENGN
ncbi:hypothetical protein B0H11DRAFT_1934701 [Mycena galericulata]|nr:hypothetical protein B0H11DRAFT_1934701 [Mycena galericulata]